jgi:prefoldin subunit 5
LRYSEIIVAIGWGKSFEEQVEEANQRASEKKAPRIPPADRVRQQRLESLELSRSRIQQQLERAVQPAHRAMLMKALQAIEKEAEEVGSETLASDP